MSSARSPLSATAAAFAAMTAAVALTVAPTPVAATCGCASMTIETAAGGYTHPLCAGEKENLSLFGCVEVSNDDLPPEYRCGSGLTPYQCPLNLTAGMAPTKWFGFEVSTVLTEGSTVGDCARGQFIQSNRAKNGEPAANPAAAATPAAGTYTFGGLTLEAVNGPTLIPALGAQNGTGQPLFGADAYTELDFKQRYVPEKRELYWWDAPGGAVPLEAPSTRDENDDFVAFVNGDAGSCWCRFTVSQHWQEDEGTGGAVRVDGSVNCTLSDVGAEAGSPGG